jgi:hypothetical protein
MKNCLRKYAKVCENVAKSAAKFISKLKSFDCFQRFNEKGKKVEGIYLKLGMKVV